MAIRNEPGSFGDKFWCKGCKSMQPLLGRRARFTAEGVKIGFRCKICDDAMRKSMQ